MDCFLERPTPLFFTTHYETLILSFAGGQKNEEEDTVATKNTTTVMHFYPDEGEWRTEEMEIEREEFSGDEDEEEVTVSENEFMGWLI